MKNFLILAFVLCGVTGTPISVTNDSTRLIGVFDASPRQFPYQASIRNQSMVHFCSGSIISSQWILTSSTCLREATPVNMRVVVGSIYLDSEGTTYNVLSMVEHPGSSDNSTNNDIGLIRVNDQITFNDFVKPVALFSGDTPADLPLTVSGWGSIGFWKIPFSILQNVVLNTISISECKRMIVSSFVDILIDSTHLCTDKFNHTVGLDNNCIQDAGSPLVYNGEQHGVASKTKSCGIFFKPDVHTRVAFYQDWIKNITNT